MRKTILILHLLLTGWLLPLVCIASEPSPGDDLPPVVPYIDESSVVFDYVFDRETKKLMGQMTFKAVIPLGTVRILSKRTAPFDYSTKTFGEIRYSSYKIFYPDPESTECEITLDRLTWGVHITFSCQDQVQNSTAATNVIYSDDYIAPDDLAQIKPNSDIDTIGDCEPVISFNDDNLEVDISEPFAFELYSLQGQCLTATTYPGKVSIPLNQYGQQLMIARITTSDQTIIRKIAL